MCKVKGLESACHCKRNDMDLNLEICRDAAILPVWVSVIVIFIKSYSNFYI